MQIDFYINFKPFSYHFFVRDPTKQKLSRIHQPGKDEVISFGNITYFYTVGILSLIHI